MWSVVSLRSIGLNQPLTGQASSSFTNPWLRRRSFRQPVFAAVDTFDLELLARLDAIALADFCGENDLTLRGNRGFSC